MAADWCACVAIGVRAQRALLARGGLDGYTAPMNMAMSATQMFECGDEARAHHAGVGGPPL